MKKLFPIPLAVICAGSTLQVVQVGTAEKHEESCEEKNQKDVEKLKDEKEREKEKQKREEEEKEEEMILTIVKNILLKEKYLNVALAMEG